MYTFATIDSRPAQRAAMLALLASAPTLGIEVTDAAIADACALGNIDPQHGHDRGALLPTGAFPAGYVREGCMAAIDVACGCALPAVGATLATIRPDLDSIGAMAILVLRALGLVDFAVPTPAAQAVWRRVCDISSADSYRPGPWAPRPLPTVHRLFNTDESAEPADGRRSLAHLGAICSPRQGQTALPIEERVAVMACWLLFGEPDHTHGDAARDTMAARIAEACGISASEGEISACGAEWATARFFSAINVARATVESARLALAEELAKPGAIRVECRHCGSPMEQDLRASHACADGCVPGLAQVRVSHAGALGAGYCLAPVVVAFDQAVHGKVTIAAAEDGRVDFAALRVALNSAEGEAIVRSWSGDDKSIEQIADWAHALGARGQGAVALQIFAGNSGRAGMSGACLLRFDPRLAGDSGAMPDARVATSVQSVVEEMRASLPAWGGPRNLLGSPHGDGTRLSEAEIVGLVREAM